MRRSDGRLKPVGVGAALVAALALCTAPAASADSGKHAGQVAKVMTRNLYLGADLGPAIRATSLGGFVNANGGVVRQVDTTNFPTRVKGLASEILGKDPDLVGLQEVALWRTGPTSLAPLGGGLKTATTVRYDFLQLLLDELNADELRYKVVVVQPEFDLEAPANVTGGNVADGPQPTPTAEMNARLTMRDVILARVDRGVQLSDPQGGNFQQLLTLPIVGTPITVVRGWTAVDAKVRGGDRFRFVNTHLEAFDPRTVTPSLRARQASELVAPGGPADSALPVVLLGDLNSDDDTVVPGDQQAYRALLDAGLVERSTNDPLSCCVSSFNLMTGSVSEFDHQVDHVMTDSPEIVKLIDSSVTGLQKNNGYWDSDHAGVFSALRIKDTPRE